MEAWQRVFVSADKFVAGDVHGQIGCITCHGGVANTDNMAEAHEGVICRPSTDPMKACGACHVDYAIQSQTNIHRLQTGYHEVLKQRGGDFTDPDFVKAYTNHCTSCHATCGDCHISRPAALGGGLIDGHAVKRVASVWLTCGGCHSARIADEYRGNHEGIPGDVHWQRQGMACTQCHSSQDYHAPSHGTRYEGAPSPGCTDCHADVGPADAIQQHNELHLDKLACQTCHAAGAYKSCYGCHTGVDDQGIKYYATQPSELTFKIGMNPLLSPDRPWEYVLVRHAPATPGLFAYYGEDLLPNFDALPTWKYATPHNVQRITPQNATCNSCHGQIQLFLIEDDVARAMRAANQPVIVPLSRVPRLLPEVPGVTAPPLSEGEVRP